jgi:DNA-binding winged helix-turn-helix (wHTH) protein
MDEPAAKIYSFEKFTLNTGDFSLRGGDKALSISKLRFSLLLALIENVGKVVSNAVLMDIVWPKTHVEESNVTQQMCNIRKLLGKNREGREFIKTVRGRGYMLDVRVTLELEAEMDSEFEVRAERRIHQERPMPGLPRTVTTPVGQDALVGSSLDCSTATGWDALAAEEKYIVGLLSGLTGGFQFDDVLQLRHGPSWSIAEAVGMLVSLVDRNMIAVLKDRPTSHGEGKWYVLLESAREYILDRNVEPTGGHRDKAG